MEATRSIKVQLPDATEVQIFLTAPDGATSEQSLASRLLRRELTSGVGQVVRICTSFLETRGPNGTFIPRTSFPFAGVSRGASVQLQVDEKMVGSLQISCYGSDARIEVSMSSSAGSELQRFMTINQFVDSARAQGCSPYTIETLLNRATDLGMTVTIKRDPLLGATTQVGRWQIQPDAIPAAELGAGYTELRAVTDKGDYAFTLHHEPGRPATITIDRVASGSSGPENSRVLQCRIAFEGRLRHELSQSIAGLLSSLDLKATAERTSIPQDFARALREASAHVERAHSVHVPSGSTLPLSIRPYSVDAPTPFRNVRVDAGGTLELRSGSNDPIGEGLRAAELADLIVQKGGTLRVGGALHLHLVRPRVHGDVVGDRGALANARITEGFFAPCAELAEVLLGAFQQPHGAQSRFVGCLPQVTTLFGIVDTGSWFGRLPMGVRRFFADLVDRLPGGEKFAFTLRPARNGDYLPIDKVSESGS